MIVADPLQFEAALHLRRRPSGATAAMRTAPEAGSMASRRPSQGCATGMAVAAAARTRPASNAARTIREGADRTDRTPPVCLRVFRCSRRFLPFPDRFRISSVPTMPPPPMIHGFARRARERIRGTEGGYRRDHLRSLAQRVEVADDAIRIMGSKTELPRTLAAGQVRQSTAAGVPRGVPKWRRENPLETGFHSLIGP